MTHKRRASLCIALLAGLTFTAGNTLAEEADNSHHCPTDIQQNHQGYWLSDAKPGWKSHKTTPRNVTVDTSNFGGVIYSPKRHQFACVYKASNGKWVVLVSKVHHGVVLDKYATDRSGNYPAWRYSKKHKDYSCGRPAVRDIATCSFQLVE